MNERDKELATECYVTPSWEFDYKKFANLIRADERERIKVANAPEIDRINTHIKNLEDAVKNEREACAKVCAALMESPELIGDCHVCVDAIRARGNT